MNAERESLFARRVASEAARKLRLQREGSQGVWFGLGMSGLIGWSVAVPTLGGIALGIWLDAHHPVAFSWTLTLLFAGLIMGCANAWYWVAQQEKALHDQETPEQGTPDEGTPDV